MLTETTIDQLRLEFQADDLSPCDCKGGPTLRAQLHGHSFTAIHSGDCWQLEPQGTDSIITDSTARVFQSDDGRIVADVCFAVRFLKLDNRREMVRGRYAADSPAGLTGAGPWVLIFQPDNCKRCACCAWPDRIVIERAA